MARCGALSGTSSSSARELVDVGTITAAAERRSAPSGMPGRAAKGVDHQARIVGDRRQTGGRAAACRAFSSAFSTKGLPGFLQPGAHRTRSGAPHRSAPPRAGPGSPRACPDCRWGEDPATRASRSPAQGSGPAWRPVSRMPAVARSSSWPSSRRRNACAPLPFPESRRSRPLRVHHDVHVRLRVGIFGVVEIENRHALVDAHGHGGDLAVDGGCARSTLSRVSFSTARTSAT